MRLIAVLFFVFIVMPLQADVYKWVDADGRVHYSANPPGNIESKRLGRPAETTEEETPEQEQARLEAIVKEAGLQKSPAATPAEPVILVDPVNTDKPVIATLDCEKAVVNARDGVDTLLTMEQGEMGKEGADKVRYEKVSAEIRKAKARISKTECKAATGDIKGFYECMMDDLNQVASCAEKYKYWDATLFPKKY